MAADASALRIDAVDPDSADAALLIAELSSALAVITGDGGTSSFAADDARAERAVFLVARDGDGRPLGCGALRPLDGDATVGEIKRMYARPGSRGVGAAVLAQLEAAAAAFGYRALCLSTRRVNLRAVDFYLRHGYSAIDGYGKYQGRDVSICLGKSVPVR